MMLDKEQIKNWDGGPDENQEKAKPGAKPMSQVAEPVAQAAERTVHALDPIAQAITPVVLAPLAVEPVASPVEVAHVIEAASPAPPAPLETPKPVAAATPVVSANPPPRMASVPQLSPEQEQARKRRSRWTAIALIAFVVLIFVITLTKLGANVLVRDL